MNKWKNDDQNYPRKRGTCDFCQSRDDLKLSYDRIRYLCINESACLLRVRKERARNA